MARSAQGWPRGRGSRRKVRRKRSAGSEAKARASASSAAVTSHGPEREQTVARFSGQPGNCAPRTTGCKAAGASACSGHRSLRGLCDALQRGKTRPPASPGAAINLRGLGEAGIGRRSKGHGCSTPATSKPGEGAPDRSGPWRGPSWSKGRTQGCGGNLWPRRAANLALVATAAASTAGLPGGGRTRQPLFPLLKEAEGQVERRAPTVTGVSRTHV